MASRQLVTNRPNAEGEVRTRTRTREPGYAYLAPRPRRSPTPDQQVEEMNKGKGDKNELCGIDAASVIVHTWFSSFWANYPLRIRDHGYPGEAGWDSEMFWFK